MSRPQNSVEFLLKFEHSKSENITCYKTFENHQQTKLYEAQVMPDAIIMKACFTVLYAKLRTIHKQFQTYAGRFQPTPSYTKEIELPLPSADAIQSFGVFTPVGMTEHYVIVPVYQENVANKRRSTQFRSATTYEAYLP